MRVKGRHKYDLQIAMSQHTPIILPKAHHLTVLKIVGATGFGCLWALGWAWKLLFGAIDRH